MSEQSREACPWVIMWIDRWGLLVVAAVFSGAVVANVAFNSVRAWLPTAITSAVMGLVAYGVLFVRFHLWVGSSHMNRRRVTQFLGGALGFAGLLIVMLLGGLVVWHREFLVYLFAISIPTGIAMSVAHLWKRRGAFPEACGQAKGTGRLTTG